MRAFTFIEVVIVLAIILLIGVLSLSFTTNFFFERQTVLASQLVRSSLARANLYALEGKAGSDWGVTQVGDNLILFSGSSYGSRNISWDEQIPIPGNVTLSSFGEIIFARPTGTTTPTTVQVVGSTRSINLSVSREGAVTEL